MPDAPTLAGAITDDIASWFEDWSGGDTMGLNAKTDIYNVVLRRIVGDIEENSNE